MQNIRLLLWWRVVITIVALLLATIPGTLATPFDGLPLSPGEALALLVLFSVIWTTSGWVHIRQRRWLATCLGALIVLNLIGNWLVPTGWSVCVRREQKPETLETACEPSIAFSGRERTFVLDSISFKADQFPLYFMNDVAAFNFHKEDEPDRETIRYSMAGQAYFAGSKKSIVIDSNIPGTRVTLNGAQYTTGPDDELVLPLDEVTVNELSFSYETGRAKSDELHISAPTRPYYQLAFGHVVPEAITAVYVVGYWLVLFVIGLITVTSAARSIARLDSGDKLLLLYVTAIAGVYVLIARAEPIILAAVAVALMWLLAHLSASSFRRTIVVPLTLLALVAASYVQIWLPYGNAELLQGGNDPLTYEGYAREVALASTARDALAAGTENIFYYQPLYRYELALVHILFGEELWGVYVVQLSLFLLALVLLARFLYRYGGHSSLIVGGVVLMCSVANAEVSFITLATTVYQEALAWPLFSFALLSLFVLWEKQENHAWWHGLVGLLWGVALFTRTDLLPALVAVATYFLVRWYQQKGHSHILRPCLGFFVGLSVAPVTVMIRNLVIAGKSALLPTSGYVNFLEPLKDAVPHVTADTFGLAVLFFDVPRAYVGQFGELMQILVAPYASYLLSEGGLRPAFLIIGVGVLAASVRILWHPGRTEWVPLLLTWSAVFPVFFFSLFFIQDNALATLSIHMIWATLIASMALPDAIWRSLFGFARRKFERLVPSQIDV